MTEAGGTDGLAPGTAAPEDSPKVDSTAYPFPPPVTPMEARTVDRLPDPPGWAYEPKWDGFRMIGWAGSRPRLDSRNRRPLLRYFPELAPALRALPLGTVVDGEIVVVTGGRLDFDALQNRIHPAASRVALLAQETPARMALFDLLGLEGRDLRSLPFCERRARLVELARSLPDPFDLTPSTEDPTVAGRWFVEFEAAGFDGVVAKPLAAPYREGERAMVKLKHRRSVDVVVGGYRLHKAGDRVGSLLLGLYDLHGRLEFVAHTSDFSADEARAFLALLETLRLPQGKSAFSEGTRQPGAISRWAGDKDLSYVPVRPEVVLQVSYDQLSGRRIRHGTRIERLRPDKDPKDCTLDQLDRPTGLTVTQVVAKAAGG